MFKIGAPVTILHKHLLRRLVHVPRFMEECRESFYIFDSMNAMSAKEPTRIAEIALQFYDDIKGPLENRITVLMALGPVLCCSVLGDCIRSNSLAYNSRFRELSPREKKIHIVILFHANFKDLFK